MMFPSLVWLFLFNVAVAVVLCSGLAFLMGSSCRKLPARHAIFVAGLANCLAVPLLVGVGWWFSLGLISVPLRQGFFETELDPTGPVAQLSNTLPHARMKDPTLPEPVLVEPSHSIVEKQTHGIADLVSENSSEVADSSTAAASSVAFRTIPTQVGTIPSFLTFIWLVGSLAIASVKLRDWLACARLSRNSSTNRCPQVAEAYSHAASRYQLRQEPELLVSESISAPVVVGMLRPRVIIPSDLPQHLTSNQIRSVLTHELAHIIRKDHCVHGLELLVTTLFWWNPIVWALSRKTATLRELICDDIVLARDVAPRDYAESIVTLAEQQVNAVPLGVGLYSRGELEHRIRRVITPRLSSLETKLSRMAVVYCMLFTLCLLTIPVAAQVKDTTVNQQGISPSGETDELKRQQTQEQQTPQMSDAKEGVAGADERRQANFEWLYDIDEARVAAKEQGKDLFVMFTGKGWCQPCEVVEQQLLHEEGVVNYVSEHFVPVELDFTFKDTDDPQEKLRESRFRNWASKYAVFGYPTFVVMDTKNRPYHVRTGWDPNLTPAKFVEDLKGSVTQKGVRDRNFSLAQKLNGEKRALVLHGGLEALKGQLGTLEERQDEPILFYYAPEVLSILSAKGSSELLEATKQIYSEKFALRENWQEKARIYKQLAEMRSAKRYEEALVLLTEKLKSKTLASEDRRALHTQYENFLALAGDLPKLLSHYSSMLAGDLDQKSRLRYLNRKATLLVYNLEQQENGLQFVEQWIASADVGSKSHREALEFKGMVLWRSSPESLEAIETWETLREINEPNTFDYLSACAYLARCKDAAGESKDAAKFYHEILNTLISQKNGKNEIPWPWNFKAIPGAYLATAEYYLKANERESARQLLQELNLESIQEEQSGQNNPAEIKRLEEWKQRLLKELRE